MIGLFHDALEALRGDLLFQMLVEDGSVKMPEDARKDRDLEQDPMKGATADGKEKAPEKEPKSDAAAKPPKGSRAKAEAGAGEKPAETEVKK